MTATLTRSYTLLGEEFDYDELIDIAQYGANTGVHGMTYSSDLYDVWVNHGEDVDPTSKTLQTIVSTSLGKLWCLDSPLIDVILGNSTTA